MRRKTPEEIAWLRSNAPLHPQGETLRLFAERFGWAPTKPSLASWMSDNGIKPPNSPTRWTGGMDAYFREIAPGRSEAEIADLFELRFGIRLTPGRIGNAKTRLGVRSGTVGGRFEKGHEPANKGKTWDETGMPPEARERILATCFKPGHMPRNADGKPVGYERVGRDGYAEVKVAERPSSPDRNDNFRLRHRLVWEEANGRPVPPSSMIVFADRDKRNFDPGNLVCVPRAEWATICKLGLAYHDRESLEAAMLTARLVQRARRLERSERMRPTCGRAYVPEYGDQRRCRTCIDAGRRKR